MEAGRQNIERVGVIRKILWNKELARSFWEVPKAPTTLCLGLITMGTCIYFNTWDGVQRFEAERYLV